MKPHPCHWWVCMQEKWSHCSFEPAQPSMLTCWCRAVKKDIELAIGCNTPRGAHQFPHIIHSAKDLWEKWGVVAWNSGWNRMVRNTLFWSGIRGCPGCHPHRKCHGERTWGAGRKRPPWRNRHGIVGYRFKPGRPLKQGFSGTRGSWGLGTAKFPSLGQIVLRYVGSRIVRYWCPKK